MLALLRARARDVPPTLLVDGVDRRARASPPLSAAIVFQTVLDARVRATPLAVATALAYPLTDLVLLGVAVGALAGTGWRLDRTWVLLAVGIVHVLARRLALPRRAPPQGTYERRRLVRRRLVGSGCC